MRRMGWELNPQILTLSLVTVEIGTGAMDSNAAGQSRDKQIRAAVETVIVSGAAAYLSRSWWPLVIPVGYLAFDHVWSVRRGHAPEIGADTEAVYDDGN